LIPIHVGGFGLFTPGFAGFKAWAAGTPDPSVLAARADLLPPTLRRRATPLASRVAVVAAEAAAEAKVELARVPLVLGSALGEQTGLEILEELRRGEGMPSPTRFHNSVHNGPVAYLSIATGNRGFSTTVAAGGETPAAALLEAAAYLSERGGDLLLVFADDPPVPPFSIENPYPPLAVALHLSAEPGPTTRAVLHGPRQTPSGAPRVPAPFADHSCAGGLALATAAWNGTEGEVALGPEGDRGWVVLVSPWRPA